MNGKKNLILASHVAVTPNPDSQNSPKFENATLNVKGANNAQ